MTALYGLLPTSLDETGRCFSFELRSAYCAEMLSHEFLPVADENGGKAFAARTVFSDGTEVVANCSDEPLTFGKLILDSHSFHIGKKRPDGRMNHLIQHKNTVFRHIFYIFEHSFLFQSC